MQPVGAGEVKSARGKNSGGNAGQFQNQRYIDPVLKDEREDEMNENLGCAMHALLCVPGDGGAGR